MAELTPNAKKVISDLAALWSRADSMQTLESNAMISALRQAEKRAFARMQTIIKEYGGLYAASVDKRSAWYVSNLASIDRALTNTLPVSSIDDYVSQYPQWARFASESIAIGGAVSSEFTAIPKKFVDFLKTRDRSFMVGILNDRAIKELEASFLANVLAGVKPSDLLATMKGYITGEYPWGKGVGRYEWHAGTYVRTLHRRASREFHTTQAKEVGLSHYLYLGPLDSKTRPFCQPLVGGVYSEAEINEMDNGQSGSGAGIVLTDAGGFNCRHDWMAVGKDLAKELGEAGPEAVEKVAEKKAPEIKQPTPKTIPTGNLMSNEAWIRSITDKEFQAFRSWKKGSYKIREYQLAKHRGGDYWASYLVGKTEKYLDTISGWISRMEQALDRAKPFKSPRLLFRGIKSVPRSTIDGWVKAGYCEFNTFSSSSKELRVAKDFGRCRPTQSTRGVLFRLRAKSGIDIERIDGYGKEREVILRANIRYKITETRDTGEFFEIWLKEV